MQIGFTILNSKKQPLNIGVINKNVAIFWNKEYNPIKGTRPYPVIDSEFSELFEGAIWTDLFLILSSLRPVSNWDDLESVLIEGLQFKNREKELFDSSLKYYKPYFDLIQYFKGLDFIFQYSESEDPEISL